MIARKLIKRLAVVAAGWLLLAQIALAGVPCMMQLAFPPAQATGEVMAMDDCVPAVDPAACLVHCLKADQPAGYSGDYQFSLALFPAGTVGPLTALPQADSAVSRLHVSGLTGGPPLQVLFCSFQI